MHVASVLSKLVDTVKPSRRPEKNETAAANPAAGSSAAMATPVSADAMREILGQYDVKNITPRSFSEMLQKLRQANAISEKDYQELSQIRMDLDRDGLGPDERVNLVEHYQRKLSNLQDDIKDLQGKTDSTAARQALQAPVLRRLDCLQKFATMHAQPGAKVDAAA